MASHVKKLVKVDKGADLEDLTHSLRTLFQIVVKGVSLNYRQTLLLTLSFENKCNFPS